MSQADFTPPPTLPPLPDGMAELVAEGACLKAQIEQRQERLKAIHALLATQAAFPPGRNTAHVIGGGFRATVQKKTSVTWDQAALNRARAALGDGLFFSLFTWEFKPVSPEALRGFLEYGDPQRSALVTAARTVSECAPYVTYTPLNQKGEE